MLQLNYAVASDRGLVRGNNEDSAFASPYLIALADGMGGHAAGEIASQIMIRHLMGLNADPQDADMAALLATAAAEANNAIAQSVREHPETDGMGTTLTALMFNSREFGMCHVGDSRGYRLRNEKLTQITVDDTYVQSLVDKGELNPEDVSTHPQRSMILKAYTGRPVEPTLQFLDARAGDRLLLCSDGLSDPVTHDTIEEALSQGNPEEAARRLVELALRSGGPDNVTVIVADVVDTAKTPVAVPTEPQIAGALDENAIEDPRPDTAAGRAAMALANRTPKVVTPQLDANSEGPYSGDYPEEPQPQAEALQHPEEKTKKPWGKITALLIALILIAGCITGGYFFKQHLDETYYIATQDEALVIEQGVEGTIFGHQTHSLYQKACLTKEGNLTLLEPEAEIPSDCSTFTTQDLKESARGSISGLPEGDYDKVLEQMQRLSEQVLPACVIRENQAKKDEETQTSESSEATSTSETESSEPSQSQENNSESESQRAGDLTSPGVNCREVKA